MHSSVSHRSTANACATRTSMRDAFELDGKQVRRAFERCAPGYDAIAWLPREITERMLERLQYLRAPPERILEAGSGTGYGARKLREYYPGARIVELDLSLPMLRIGAVPNAWWRRSLAYLKGARRWCICADLGRLPLRTGSFDMVWSNLVLHWVSSTEQAIAELWRVLTPGGVLMFSTFGPDTLRELRRALSMRDHYAHVNRFLDMHDLGDMLLRARFADPVMDAEHVTATYPDVRALLRELRAGGSRNANAGRRPGLTGKGFWSALSSSYERQPTEGRLAATFEIVYGHAWKPTASPARADGRAVITVHPRQRRDLL